LSKKVATGGNISRVKCAVFAAAVAICGTVVAPSKGSAQVTVDAPMRYFLDIPPGDIDRARVPPNARDVVIAKVRIVAGPIYTFGRHAGDGPPQKDLLAARLEVVETLTGSASVGEQFTIYFGVPGSGRRYKVPQTPPQIASEHFIVSYVEGDNVRRLLAFGITEQEYDEWWNGWLRYLQCPRCFDTTSP
jgi:hypothetical protein